jgi:hypothetical protein
MLLNESAGIMASQNFEIRRETLDQNTTRLSCGNCSFTYRRLKPGTLLLTITGNDKGQFGTATIDEVRAEFERFGVVTLFVDTHGANGPSTEVMEAWTAFFSANRQKLKRVAIMVSPESKLLHLTVSIVQHLSGTGDLLQIFGDVNKFRAAILQEVPNCPL